MKICDELKKVLRENEKILFDVSGGCGIDTSLGKNGCMNAAGIWFKYCPFCGKKIEKKYNGLCWEWWEEPNETPTKN